jgi:CubicO group peptidase (beta-lactamase class C family)
MAGGVSLIWGGYLLHNREDIEGSNMNYHLFKIILLLCLILFSCHGQPVTTSQRIDRFLVQCYEKDMFNGAVLVAEKSEIIYQKAYGVASYKTGQLLSDKSQFRLASVSKQFTAMAIMILQERNLLQYDDMINRYIPELPYKNITIRHLLTNTSGLPDYMELFEEFWDIGKKDQPDRKIATNNDVIRLLTDHKPLPLFSPGDKFLYSNTGYVILASIVERVSGQTFDLFLKDHIFTPLDMSFSLVYSPIKNQPMAERVYGFRKYILDDSYTEVDFHYLNGIAGDGAVYATTGDLFKWDQALYTSKLVKSATLEQAFTAGNLNDEKELDYGFGWRIKKSDTGKKIVQHGGGWVGFRTFIYRDIENRNTLILLTNNSNLYLTDIRKALINIWQGKPYQFPRKSIAQVIGPIVMSDGIDKAMVTYDNLKTHHADDYQFDEPILNFLGYELLRVKKTKEAIVVFERNTKAYPHSFNVYDSLGEAYMIDGQIDPAIENYKKSLELNPDNKNAKDKLEELNNL